MSARTGLAAEVPTMEPCKKMAGIPALAKAFKKSVLIWCPVVVYPVNEATFAISERHECVNLDGTEISAPTVREMLAWLNRKGHLSMNTDKATDPDALARACIEAAR